jgi:transcriptional regulator with XRE-family HTH domain
MQTIGERLEEARKRRGVSIQDAAAATKIREEYLLSMEKNSGSDISLEPIYVRGFIKNYAKFLRVDPSRLVTDFDAAHAEEKNAEAPPKSQKELIGRLELGSETPPLPTLPIKRESPIETAETAAAPVKVSDDTKEAAWPKWVLPVVIGFAAVIVIAVFAVGVDSYYKARHAAKAALATSEIKLVATGTVTVAVKQLSNNATIFYKTLKKGEDATVSRQGSVRILYSEGNLLEVQKDGKVFKMGAAGAGKRVID